MPVVDEEPWPVTTETPQPWTVFEWMTDPAPPPPPPASEFVGWGVPLN